jgi:translation initiation factor IF-2
VNIGPIHKKDIMKASTMLEHDDQYVILLCFVSVRNSAYMNNVILI